jgi:hypothetical protein
VSWPPFGRRLSTWEVADAGGLSGNPGFLMLELEQCPFIRSIEPGAEPGTAPSSKVRCWADGSPREIGLRQQRQQCFSVSHTSCSALLSALEFRPADDLSEIEAATRLVAESCHLAQARLEVQAERLGSQLRRIFGTSA